MDLLIVHLQNTDSNLIKENALSFFYYPEEFLQSSVVDSSSTFNSFHGKCFTSAGLSISKDANIESI